MRILIADDHHIVRRGLVEILAEIDWVTEIVEANDGFGVLNLLNREEFDILILDIAMPGKDGFELLHYIKDLGKRIKVLVLSNYPEELFAVRAFMSGAFGYLNKNSAPEELELALNSIRNNHKYIQNSLHESLANYISSHDSDLPHKKLSDREFQIFTLLAEGKTNEEISKALCLSKKTVSTHKINVLTKLNLKNSAQLVLYSIKNKLVI